MPPLLHAVVGEGWGEGVKLDQQYLNAKPAAKFSPHWF